MNMCANLWPDSLSGEEAKRDLGYEPQVGLAEMVSLVLQGHEERNSTTAGVFKV